MSKSFKALHAVQTVGLTVLLGVAFFVGAHPQDVSADTREALAVTLGAKGVINAVGRDTDGDGVVDRDDYDDDNDGVADANDAFPLQASEWLDTDGDGIGDASDETPFGENSETADEQDATATVTQGFSKSVRTDTDYQRAIDELVNDANAIVGERTGKSKIAGTASAINIQPTGQGVTITSLRGLRDAGLPKWAQFEALAEFGYSSWNEVPADQLDVSIEPQAFSVDAMTVVEQVVAAGAGTPNSNQTKGLLNFCKSSWSTRHWDDSVRIARSGRYEPINESSSNGYISGSLSGSIQGEAMAEIDYATKARKCIGIPYKARLDSALVDIALNVDGSVDLNGAAELEWRKTLERNFQLFSKTFQFRVKIFTFQLRLQSDLTVGTRIDARAKADINARADLLGEVAYRWECTGKICNKTKSEERLELTTSEDNGYSANIDVTVTPYIEVAADVRFRLKSIATLVEARAAILAAAPLSLHLAACGQDIDADGKLEHSAGAFFDVSLEVYGYFTYDYLTGTRKTQSFPISLPGFRTIQVAGTEDSMYTVYPGNGLSAGDLVLYKSVKVLKTAALTSGSGDVLRPVLSIANGGISISPQRCYPFAGEPMYEINWGDGTPSETVSAGVAMHRFGNSNQSVSARIVGDSMGRSLSSNATAMVVAAGSGPVIKTPTKNPTPIFPDACGKSANQRLDSYSGARHQYVTGNRVCN